MTEDDITRMAQEAGWSGIYSQWVSSTEREHLTVPVTMEQIKRFANLVAAAEREKVARWQIGSGYTTGHGETIEDLLVELEWQVRESEREACAKVCEEAHWSLDDRNEYATAIRARGQHD